MSKNRDRQSRQIEANRGNWKKNARGELLLDFFENIGVITQGGVVMSNG